MRVTAAVSRGVGEPMAVETLEMREPRGDEVVVRVVASGVCHTDWTTRKSFPAGLPIVLGHEGAGVVERVGQDVSGISVGDRVLMTYQSCGVCAECSAGVPGYCADWAMLNAGRFGADSPLRAGDEPVTGAFFGQSSFASHVLATARNVVVVDEDVDLVRAAAFGCAVQTGAGAVTEVLRPDSASVLAIFGAGGVGMSALLAARAIGVGTVVAVDVSPERLLLARELGADVVVDGNDPDVAGRISALGKGGATHALDTTGLAGVMKTAIEALAPRGVLTLVGLGESPVPVEVSALIGRGKTLRGCIEGDVDPQVFLPRLVRWQREGKLPMRRLVREYPLERVDDAMADAASGAVVKPVIVLP
ncbi:NAD(P)-dependent alcohol dehydrogenase [Nocardia takedensis]|uniref:NAD(P)-dependent alcohol dehydrogenase n=1 Tax=Nocardia takedensis TaxID=259390 RepID=UPI0005939C05|nr:NAD(P)-dependent alcohol dehydrogenase [Nocardia takedensis]